MKEKPSVAETKYRPRLIADRLRRSLDVNPCVVLTGARQSGKSTLLQAEPPFSGWRYVTMDDPDALAAARDEPASLWTGTDGVVLDEVQRMPSLLEAVKLSIDRDGGARFALSGSANLLLMQRVTESLAGRASYLELLPMTLSEAGLSPARPGILEQLLAGDASGTLSAEKTGAPLPDPMTVIATGLMPPVVVRAISEDLAGEWWGSYVATYLERDLRQLANIVDLVDFRRVMEAAALRSGQLLRQVEVARDVGISGATVYRYLRLLEAGGVLYRLPAYTSNRTKRLMKSPKVHLFDPALAAYLGGLHGREAIRGAREAGALFEGLVIHHLRVHTSLLGPPAGRLHHWRTVSGAEVDAVVEHGRRILPIEIKLTGKPRFRDASGLRSFLADHPGAPLGLVVHTGSDCEWLGEKILAAPWTVFA